MSDQPRYPGIRVTTNGNYLVGYLTEARYADGGIFYPITSSTQMGEYYQQAFAEGKLSVFGASKLAVETEGEHAAQGGAIAYSVCGKRVVNFTSGQGIAYGVEQYYHAPGKLSTMVLEVAARALTKHALNVHCGHDDAYAALDTGWIMLFAKDAQQAADQALILRRVTELALTPGMNIQDGFLTSHLERTFYYHESDLIREFLGAPDDEIECPTEAQRELFGPTRRRVPKVIDLQNPQLVGPVQNQEHYMNGVLARRNCFIEPIMGFLDESYEKFAELTGRRYGQISCYRTDDAEIVYVSLGCAAENIEAAVDHLRDTRGAKVGSIHFNILRPFPENAIVEALRGKQHVIVLERTDEPLAGDNPLGRNIRTALSKALDRPCPQEVQQLSLEECPSLVSGAYGLGSRDFRPEGIIGAYEFVTGKIARKDGRRAADGTTFFTVGIDHPYDVGSEETPSLLPDHAIAIRLHSIGGWGMITTGKNLGEVIGTLGEFVTERDEVTDEFGRPKEVVHVSANPKYGSEKKGAPTSYFLVVAPERIRVNCDLRHVNVVLCCDPKAFLHTNPMAGMAEGGALVMESDESPVVFWQRIPKHHRQEIIDKNIRLFTLPGFDIARQATDRPDLQLRMQGNAFLGAFFAVSPFLEEFKIETDHFYEVVRNTYVQKFSRFGEAVVESNMEVMRNGFDRITAVPYGDRESPDRSAMRGQPLIPLNGVGLHRDFQRSKKQAARTPMTQAAYFDAEYRAGLGYDQPASCLAAVGCMPAGSGGKASKYVARRETPVFVAENCTQCMECIAACPDTALPNTAQDIGHVLSTAINNYVRDTAERAKFNELLPELEQRVRAVMVDDVKAKQRTPFQQVVRQELDAVDGQIAGEAKEQFFEILDQLPIAYSKVNAIFGTKEKKDPGSGGLFFIFVSDLCKGCAECVVECGDHEALKMVDDTEAINTQYASATTFFNQLPDTPQKFLGLYDKERPQDSKQATLRNHLMVRRNYEALVSGDGACAGCGEKSVLRAVTTVTEAYMRPLYHAKADRLLAKAERLEREGASRLSGLAAGSPEVYERYRTAVAHLVMGLGGEDEADTQGRIAQHGEITDQQVSEALSVVLRTEAFNHKEMQSIDGQLANGMSVMAMGAHTGCNTVYGSTPPNNPHPYPWLNSLFQDGATISWLMGENFIKDHGRRSVIPERLADALLDRDGDVITEDEFFDYTHFSDTLMTHQEILELPKVWCVGGDGGMGDIGFQNVSKVTLQNRPNVKMVMLDTQVYSNTGGQNSDSTPCPGGGDMNQFGSASQGKLIEKKSVSEILTSGHGSPFVAQVSMANAPKFFKAVLDALEYRGTAFFQCFTTCQPEHGVGDSMATQQAQRIRDSRGMPEFVYDPSQGESYQEALSVKGNPAIDRDWYSARHKPTKEKFNYTPAHWATTEARFRPHFKRIKPEQAESLIYLDDFLVRLTQQDIVQRRFIDPEHRSFIPDFGVYIKAVDNDDRLNHMLLSRQMVLFCVERRKAWRMLQSKAGVENKDYVAQRELLAKVDADEITLEELKRFGAELIGTEIEVLREAQAVS